MICYPNQCCFLCVLKVYWKTILEDMNISFSVPPECILREDPTHPGGHWLPEAHTNPATNCLCLNGKRNPDDIALIWQDGGADKVPVKKMTFRELRSAVW